MHCTHCSPLQPTATHCNPLQPTTTHCCNKRTVCPSSSGLRKVPCTMSDGDAKKMDVLCLKKWYSISISHGRQKGANVDTRSRAPRCFFSHGGLCEFGAWAGWPLGMCSGNSGIDYYSLLRFICMYTCIHAYVPVYSVHLYT